MNPHHVVYSFEGTGRPGRKLLWDVDKGIPAPSVPLG